MLKNIKSIYTIEMIFQYMKNKRKMKMIKYNKKIQNNLKITKDDFQVYERLKAFNEEYSTNIEDIDDKEIIINKKNLDNEGLKLLSEIKFTNLKILSLQQNKITDIKSLENFEFKNLEKLDLGYNKIKDIKPLDKIEFKKLKELNLCCAEISDIKILTKFKLEKLNISSTEISDIKILEDENF